MMFGLAKIYPAGTFLPSEVNAFFTEFKTRLVEGGVVVQQNEVSEFRWGASGVISGQQSDDSPFWGLSGSDNYSAYAYTGEDDGHVTEQTSPIQILTPTSYTINLYAAASAKEGWWWIAAREEESGRVMSLVVGASSRRYPADVSSGLVARYGLLTLRYGPPWPRYHIPYAVNVDSGLRQADALLSVFSPLGYRSAWRQAGSPLPRMIAPLYPATGWSFDAYKTYAAAVMGESDAVMLATDGYAWGEVAQPGWRVFGDNEIGFFALRSPEVFDSF